MFYQTIDRLKVPFEGDPTNLETSWPVRFNTHTMTVEDDPVLGPARQVIRMAPGEGDGTTTNPNPRAQLQGPNNIYPGDEFWAGWGVLLPADGYPSPTLEWPLGWNSVFQMYGEPFAGYPPFRFAFEGLSGFGWRREPDAGGHWACQVAPQYGAWMDFAARFHMSADPTIGFVEVWSNFGDGWQQEPMVGGGPYDDRVEGGRLYTKTITPAVELGPLRTDIQNYRKAEMYDEATLWHAGHRQGLTLDAVDPHSY